MDTIIIDIFQTALLVITFTLVALLLYKTRKIHLATYNLVTDTARVHKEIDVLFSQIQALLALERKLALPQALPPLRGWAGSPDFLLRIASEIEERKPGAVLECSSGVSTLVVARCLQMNGKGHVFSLEHDPSYATTTRKLLGKYNLSDWATVLDAPLETKHTETPWYREESIPKDLGPVDMLIIDGPPATVAPLARFPALPRLLSRLSTTSLIVMDDANRDDETEIVNRWLQMFPMLLHRDGYCEKGCALLEYNAGSDPKNSFSVRQ